MSTAAYFTKMVSISDELAATGKPLDEDDVFDHILQRLLHEPDYNGFVSAISTHTATEQPIGLSELFSLLLSAEARIAAQNTAFHSANLAARGGGRGNPRGGNNSGGGSRGYINNNAGAHYPDNPGGGGFGGGLRQGGGDRGDREREKCQICNLEGHDAWRCKKRFDRNFNNNFCNPAGGGGGGGRGGGGGQRSANAAHAYGVDTNWYLDTDATDQVTGELEKLAVRDRYIGTKQIHTASGQGMDVAEGNMP
ncbi:uncharacterized protein [Aegilops tauschii subsp. strangulata]|uniref:uncharacterized protein n=1 Tax=Aegilops tauschii subsp. strangulata TaxID=200361 RepID=UPI003CC88D63